MVDDDSQFFGLELGIDVYGEIGVICICFFIQWGVYDSGVFGDFYFVMILVDGIEIVVKVLNLLVGIQVQIGVFDYDCFGNYVVCGMDVKVILFVGNSLSFFIVVGIVDVFGIKVQKWVDILLIIDIVFNIQSVMMELYIYVVNIDGSVMICVNYLLIVVIFQVVVIKEWIVIFIKGVGNGFDFFFNVLVFVIVSVVQGGMIYVVGISYKFIVDVVDWLFVGVEFVIGLFYNVIFQYFDIMFVIFQVYDCVMVGGGVVNKFCFVSYDFKLLCFDCFVFVVDGMFSYFCGQLFLINFWLLVELVNGLLFVVLKYDWIGVLVVEMKKKCFILDEQIDLCDCVNDFVLLIGLNWFQMLILGCNVGKMFGIFVDFFNDDSYCDVGEVQDVVIVCGFFQFVVDIIVILVYFFVYVMLIYINEIIVEQLLVIICYKINEYQNFFFLFYKMMILLVWDFWVEYQINCLFMEMQVFGSGNDFCVILVVSKVFVIFVLLVMLCQILVNFLIEGMGVGEMFIGLIFDGVNVNLGGFVVNLVGVVSGFFVIFVG